MGFLKRMSRGACYHSPKIALFRCKTSKKTNCQIIFRDNVPSTSFIRMPRCLVHQFFFFVWTLWENHVTLLQKAFDWTQYSLVNVKGWTNSIFYFIGATSYTILIRSSSGSSEAILRSIETTATSFEVDALVPGETYYFSIRSKGFGGKLSKESPRVRAQTGNLRKRYFIQKMKASTFCANVTLQ